MRAPYHVVQPTISQIVSSRSLAALSASTTETKPTVEPRNSIVDWSRIFDEKINPARRLDTRLTPQLATLRDVQGVPVATPM